MSDRYGYEDTATLNVLGKLITVDIQVVAEEEDFDPWSPELGDVKEFEANFASGKWLCAFVTVTATYKGFSGDDNLSQVYLTGGPNELREQVNYHDLLNTALGELKEAIEALVGEFVEPSKEGV